MSLARLPTLTQAMLNIPSDFPAYIHTLPSHASTLKSAFSKVSALCIYYRTLASVVAFINHFTFNLKNICVSSDHQTPSTGPSIGKFCAALASSSSSSIREIAILDKYHSSTTYQGLHPLGISELRCLFRFERLDILYLDLYCPILLDDATLLEMSHSWPNLSRLLLKQNGDYDPASSVTPLALVRLLDRCPKLKLLALAVDFSTIDSENFDPSTVDGLCDPCRMHNRANLSELWLGSYHIKYPHAIAKFLASLVPGRADITMKVEGDVDYVYKKKWKLTLTYREQLLNEEGGEGKV
ncbi:hypothetical protein BJ138DRAFT_1120001 [Hygrophoropsis aurantiaca]|uniref:Uncharacterized protein n=1 Tax=Hygrophoropsis aurantiaca TaxID=72124 RepID=A0ACB7ZSL7_9AGAM|nr:hypothetical protein BJ138DRAFT_1120001 [Hygrophoropsis aurantiaca]